MPPVPDLLSRRAAQSLAYLLALLSLASLTPTFAQGVQRGSGLPAPLPLFPADNWWNVDISSAPVDPGSASYISFIGGAGRPLHPDFGGDVDPSDPFSTDIYGMVYITVPATQPLVPVTFVEFGSQSDSGAPGRPPGYPIPPAAQTGDRWIEGGAPATATGGDRHMLLVDRDDRILYELYHTHWNAALSRWEAGSGAIFPLDSNQRRPDTWTSADAAGLAILPGLIRYDEAFGSAPIRHAFRVTVQSTNGYVWPASHQAGSTPGALPMGARLRLKPGTSISGFTAEVQRMFQAMKTYGLIVADNGSNMYIQGTYDTRWNNDVLNPAFSALRASDFEVIQLGWKPAVSGSAGPLDFYTLPPCRLLDTRNPYGPSGGPALASGSQRVFTAAGSCGVPASAKALALNLAIASAPGQGFVTLFPGDGVPGGASAINFAAGWSRANNAIVKLSSSGSGTLGLLSFSPAGPVNVILDVMGYFE
jgi:hypothetical protein